jgi:hypothetical protein
MGKRKRNRKNVRGNRRAINGNNKDPVRAPLQINAKGWGQQTSHISRVVGAYDKWGVTLVYQENSIPFAASPTPAAQVFRVNSLFDPNLTGTGHQPDFFDQWKTMYSEYLVTGVRAEITICNNSSTVSAFVVATFSDVNNSTNSVESLSENKYAIAEGVGPSTGLGIKKILMPYMKMTKLMGQSSIEGDPYQYSPVTADPTDVGYLIFKAAAADAVSNLNLFVNFKLFHECIFKELVSPTES